MADEKIENRVANKSAMRPEVAILLEQAWRAYDEKRFLEIAPLLKRMETKARELNDKPGEVISVFAFGELYRALNLNDQATEYEARANKLAQAGGDKAMEAKILLAVAQGYMAISQPEKSNQFLQRALQLRRELNDSGGQAEILILIGEFRLYETGETQAALGLYQEALRLGRMVQNERQQAQALYHIAQLFSEYGMLKGKVEIEEILSYYQEALQLWTKIGDDSEQAECLRGMANLQSILLQWPESLKLLEQALRKTRSARVQIESDIAAGRQTSFELYTNTHREASLLATVGGLKYYRGAREESQTLLEQALNLYQQAHDRRAQASTRYMLGVIKYAGGQKEAAKSLLTESLAQARELGDFNTTATVLLQMAHMAQGENELEEAAGLFKQALQLIEKVRAEISVNSIDKLGFLASRLTIYHEYVQLLLKLGRFEEAFYWAEKTKARTLLDLMQESHISVRQGISAEEANQEKKLLDHTSAINKAIISEGIKANYDAKHLQELKEELTRAETDLQNFRSALYAAHPDLENKRAARTVTLEQMPEFLPEDTALLDYVVMDGSLVLLVVANENGKAVVHYFQISLTRSELEEKSNNFRRACADPGSSFKVQARELYDALLAPAHSALKNKKRLIICPDGALWNVPFQALQNTDGKFLLETHKVVFAYSATATAAAFKVRPQSLSQLASLLVVANPDFGGHERFGRDINGPTRPLTVDSRPLTSDSRPLTVDSRPLTVDSRALLAEARTLGEKDESFLRADGTIAPLPGTQREAAALQQDFPEATMGTGTAAQESLVKQHAGAYRYLHFATHGFFNNAAPMLSSIVMAQPPAESAEDGLLTAREIFDLKWNADLVVLSACNTGRGAQHSGEGVVGLMWAVFVAGVPSQIVSHWAVSDNSTADLMKNFYANLKKGQSKDKALQEASLDLMKHKPHPYYWAPFILNGDWRHVN